MIGFQGIKKFGRPKNCDVWGQRLTKRRPNAEWQEKISPG
jgi:hypothetical protein